MIASRTIICYHLLKESMWLIHSSFCILPGEALVCVVPDMCQCMRDSDQRGSKLIDRHVMDSTEQIKQLQSPEVAILHQTGARKLRWDHSVNLHSNVDKMYLLKYSHCYFIP